MRTGGPSRLRPASSGRLAQNCRHRHESKTSNDGDQHGHEERPSRSQEDAPSFLFQPVADKIRGWPKCLLAEARKGRLSLPPVSHILGSHPRVAQPRKSLSAACVLLGLHDDRRERTIGRWGAKPLGLSRVRHPCVEHRTDPENAVLSGRLGSTTDQGCTKNRKCGNRGAVHRLPCPMWRIHHSWSTRHTQSTFCRAQ
jgi:hypothetical protein